LKWLNNEEGGVRANLRDSNLRDIIGNYKESNMYQIAELSFFGSSLVLESNDVREIVKKLREIGAENQGRIFDGGFELYFNNVMELDIDEFIEEHKGE